MNHALRTTADAKSERDEPEAERRRAKEQHSQRQIGNGSTPPAPFTDDVECEATNPHSQHIATPSTAPASTVDEEFVWDQDAAPADNYQRLGQQLAATDEFYRRPGPHAGLLRVSGRVNDEPTIINNSTSLEAAIVDSVSVRCTKNGETKALRIPGRELNALLRSEVFLRAFEPTTAYQFAIVKREAENAD
jgi:hypothetical protein